MVGEVDEFMGTVQHVAQAVGKDAAVPQCALGDVLLRRFGVGLLKVRTGLTEPALSGMM